MPDPSSPAYGPPALATGLTFLTVSVAPSSSLPPSSSVTVSFRMTVPLSLQVIFGCFAVGSSNLQVAPLMKPGPAVYSHDQVNVSLLPASVAEPYSWTGEPSSPEYDFVVPPPALATGSTLLTVRVA